ncbi:hypothetical protein A2U01_0099024, partial [Trifolium medium]|nr:hypothetical protein [Trifolium medium]
KRKEESSYLKDDALAISMDPRNLKWMKMVENGKFVKARARKKRKHGPREKRDE